MKYLIILAIVVLSSCVTAKKCNIKFPPSITRDSIYVETVKKVPVYIKGDSILVEVPIDCPDQEVIISETGKLKQIISILNGKLSAKTNLKPDTIFVDRIDTRIEIKRIEVPTPVKFTPKWIIVLSWIGVAFIGILALYLYRKVFS